MKIWYYIFFFFLILQTMVFSSEETPMIIPNIRQAISQIAPEDWTVEFNGENKTEFIIKSEPMKLRGDYKTGDQRIVEANCVIKILVVERIDPGEIDEIKTRNRELLENLPPQGSKENLGNWYRENAETLKILESEPTHYDENFSYRIECRRIPFETNDRELLNDLLDKLNGIFKSYENVDAGKNKDKSGNEEEISKSTNKQSEQEFGHE